MALNKMKVMVRGAKPESFNRVYDSVAMCLIVQTRRHADGDTVETDIAMLRPDVVCESTDDVCEDMAGHAHFIQRVRELIKRDGKFMLTKEMMDKHPDLMDKTKKWEGRFKEFPKDDELPDPNGPFTNDDE